MSTEGYDDKGGAKKHPCADCRFCQWCGDDRCNLCRGGKGCGKKKLSIAEQIALFESINGGTPDDERQ